MQVIAHLEQTVTDLLIKCAHRTTQFSTKFVVQKMISTSGKQMKDLRKNKSGNPDKLLLPVQWIADQKIEEHLNKLVKPFDMENLNFIEATNLGIILNEYLLACYRSIERRASSAELKKIIRLFITLKTAYVAELKKDHVRLSKET